MPGPEHDNGVRLDLGDEEAWVLHAALVDHLDNQTDGLDSESTAVELVDQLEANEDLVVYEPGLSVIRDILSAYLSGAPLRDRALCRGVLTQVREEL